MMPTRLIKKFSFSFIFISFTLLFTAYFITGCNIERKDKDVYEASGNYIFSSQNHLLIDVRDTDFPDDCKLLDDNTDIIEFDSVSASTKLVLGKADGSGLFNQRTIWKADGDSNSGIKGRWKYDEEENGFEYNLTLSFDDDGTFTLKAKDIDCNDIVNDIGSEDEVKYTADGEWKITFDEKNGDFTLTKNYILTENREDDTFTLVETNLTDETDEIFDGWSGAVLNQNTFKDYSVTNFSDYEDDNGNNFLSGKFTVDMTFTLDSDIAFTGDYKITREYNEDIDSQIAEYTISGKRNDDTE